MRSRCSTSRSIRTPPSDDNKPPSNVATTDFPETGDRPGNGSIELIMVNVVSQKWCGFESIAESYAPSKACATFGSLLQIIMGKVSRNVGHRVNLAKTALPMTDDGRHQATCNQSWPVELASGALRQRR